MTEDEWIRSSDTNAMFAALGGRSDAQLAAFNIACCRRIASLISDDATRRALDALENAPDHATIPAELAQAALLESSDLFNPASRQFDPSRNFNAAKAVAHAAWRSLAPGSSQVQADALENARLVALYCQWAVGEAADPDADDDDTDEETEPGSSWIRERAQKAEASAQCDLIRKLFARGTDKT